MSDGRSKSQNDSAGLFGSVRALTRRSSDGLLALVTGAGLTGATIIAMYRPQLWRAGLLCVMLAAFGGYGIAQRSVLRVRWVLPMARLIAAVTGSAAAIALLTSLIAFALIR